MIGILERRRGAGHRQLRVEILLEEDDGVKK
jgi:hypothetical protein